MARVGLRILLLAGLVVSWVGLLSHPWWLELLGHFRLQYTLFALVLGAVFYWVRDRLCLLLWISVLLSNLFFLAPFYWGASPGRVEAKALLCNVLSSNAQPHRVLQLLQQERPDLVVLLEVTRAWEGHLAPVLKDFSGQVRLPREDNFGIMLLTREKLAHPQVVGREALPIVLAEARVAGKSLHLVAAHPPPPISATHAYYRDEYLKILSDLVEQQPGPCVMLGDLNDTPWSPSLRPLNQTMRNARKGFGLQPSWPTMLPLFCRIPIDHCYLRGEIQAVDLRLGPPVGSDHFPVVVDLQL